jgi:hypothetical protein
MLRLRSTSHRNPFPTDTHALWSVVEIPGEEMEVMGKVSSYIYTKTSTQQSRLDASRGFAMALRQVGRDIFRDRGGFIHSRAIDSWHAPKSSRSESSYASRNPSPHPAGGSQHLSVGGMANLYPR